MPTPKLTAEIITAAILGFEEQKRHIDTKIGELRALLPGDPPNPPLRWKRPPGSERNSLPPHGSE